MELDINVLRKICMPENIELTMHAAKRLEQRGISINDVINCIMNGEIIEQYETDYPYQSCLILGVAFLCVKNIYMQLLEVINHNFRSLWHIIQTQASGVPISE